MGQGLVVMVVVVVVLLLMRGEIRVCRVVGSVWPALIASLRFSCWSG